MRLKQKELLFPMQNVKRYPVAAASYDLNKSPITITDVHK